MYWPFSQRLNYAVIYWNELDLPRESLKKSYLEALVVDEKLFLATLLMFPSDIMDFRVLWLLIPITSLTSGFYRVEAFLGGEKPDRNVQSVYFPGGGVPLPVPVDGSH